jgi:RNA polymerase-binding transcription factor
VSKTVVKKASAKAAKTTLRAAAPAKKAAAGRAAPAPKGKAKAKAAPPVKKSSPAKPVIHKKPPIPKKASVPSKSAAVSAKKAPAPKVAPAKKAAPVKTAPVKSVAPSAKAAPPAPPRKAATPAAAKPAAAATPAAAVAKVAVPVPTLVPGAPLAMPNGFVPRKPGRGTPKYFVAPVQAPLPPPTSRFADRFAPPRPPTREMNKVENDTPRQAHKADPKLANAWKSKAGRDLSDDEVMAMPEAEYMNEKQLEFFRMKLQALKDDLLSNAGETTEHLREDTSIVPDPADRATIEEEHALELRTRDRERKLLKKISQSLGRLESGEYGFCDETGEPIGLGRLIARPTATLSLEAQQRRELKQKMFGD